MTATFNACGSGSSSHGASPDTRHTAADSGSGLDSATGDDSSSSSGGGGSGGSPDSTSAWDSGSSSDSSSSSSGSGGGADSGSAVASAPCDIFASGGTPCVAAHSTVRALYAAYDGKLYQVERASDKTTKDIGIMAAGGLADSSAQDAFCAGTTCTISILYDQSPKVNDLAPAPGGGAVPTADKPANATDLKITISGHSAYGILIHPGMGYRNDKTSGIATGDQPETEYMVTSAKYANSGCCFDYGNAETDNHDDNAGTMEAVYFGTAFGTLNGGSGTGPWVEADLENGLFAGEALGKISANMTLNSDYVTAVVVGRSGSFALSGNDATSGTLQAMYDGPRPSGYDPMKKQGAIILGIGGDNSNSSAGAFYEGVMTSGAATNATLDAVQANIAAAGYGK